jgi:hypothetical protein
MAGRSAKSAGRGASAGGGEPGILAPLLGQVGAGAVDVALGARGSPMRCGGMASTSRIEALAERARPRAASTRTPSRRRRRRRGSRPSSSSSASSPWRAAATRRRRIRWAARLPVAGGVVAHHLAASAR